MNLLLIALILPSLALSGSVPPTPFPVFLRSGFSSVLEFEDAPTKVVLGDTQSFQVEKLDRSLIVKPLAAYATSNMFVYFKNEPTRLFVLTANEDAEPTYYKNFESIAPPKSNIPLKVAPVSYAKGGRLLKAQFDQKKDYLTVEIALGTDSSEPIKPNWDLVRLQNGKTAIAPSKLWAERKEIQKDSEIKARFIFTKPNVPRNLGGLVIVVPVRGSASPIRVSIGRL